MDLSNVFVTLFALVNVFFGAEGGLVWGCSGVVFGFLFLEWVCVEPDWTSENQNLELESY